MQYIHMQIVLNSQFIFLLTLLLFIEVNALEHSYESFLHFNMKC